MLVCVPVYAHVSADACGDQKRASDPQNWSYSSFEHLMSILRAGLWFFAGAALSHLSIPKVVAIVTILLSICFL